MNTERLERLKAYCRSRASSCYRVPPGCKFEGKLLKGPNDCRWTCNLAKIMVRVGMEGIRPEAWNLETVEEIKRRLALKRMGLIRTVDFTEEEATKDNLFGGRS